MLNAQGQQVESPGMPPIPTKWAVLVDLDGTVANHEERLELLPKEKGGDWEPFYRNQINDPVFDGVAEIVRRLQDLFIVIVTARPEKYRQDSAQWLVNNQIPYDAMLMRDDGDFRPNDEIKQEHLDIIKAMGWTPFIAFEDHPDTIKMYREAGIETLAASSHWTEYGGGDEGQ